MNLWKGTLLETLSDKTFLKGMSYVTEESSAPELLPTQTVVLWREVSISRKRHTLATTLQKSREKK